MQQAKGTSGPRIPQHPPQRAITLVLGVAQPVAVIDGNLPPADHTAPAPDMIGHADVVPEHVTAPAIVVPGDPHDLHTRVGKISEGRENAKTGPRDHGFPFEPEVVEIAIDDKRSGPALEMLQEVEQCALHFGSGNTQMGV